MKIYNNEFRLISDIIVSNNLKRTFDVIGDLHFNLPTESSVVRRNIENNILNISVDGDGIHIENIEEIGNILKEQDYLLNEYELKNLMWVDFLYFNRVDVDGEQITKGDFLQMLLDEYMKSIMCRSLILSVKIKERIVKFNYFVGGECQRTCYDLPYDDYELVLAYVFDLTIQSIFERHPNACLIGVSPNRELASADAYMAQLARISKMKHLGSKFRFRKAKQ